MKSQNFTAMSKDKGLNLFDFLECRGLKEQDVLDKFDRGLITLNGEQVELDYEIKLSDQIAVNRPVAEKKIEMKLPEVLYEDEDVVAYNKESDTVVVADRNQVNSGLLGYLRQLSGHPEGPPFLLHRLDRGTSGVWIVAKTLKAKKHITDQFVNNQVTKQYRAIVQGVLFEKEGDISERIDKHPHHPTKMILGRGGKEADSSYKILRQFRHYAVVRVWPKTGRTHQVRLHMRSLGHPLLIDDFYGGMSEFFLSKIKPNYKTSKKRAEKPLISRLTLHCEAMELFLPSLGSKLKIEAPLAKDLARLERNLQNYD